ncbi:MAG: RNA polymerase sigma factor [Patescibacteria group bacterium]
MDLNIDDNKLIESYFNGDEQSFSILVKKYLDSVYSFAYIYVKDGSIAEDITSDVFLKVFKNIKKFDKNKKFKTWIFEITKNTALDYIKKKKDINFSSIELDNNKEDCFENLIEDESKLQDEIFDIKNDASIVKKEIDKLPLKYREIINLYYISELNFREISEFLNESIDTVKSKHRRALISLKKSLNKNRN